MSAAGGGLAGRALERKNTLFDSSGSFSKFRLPAPVKGCQMPALGRRSIRTRQISPGRRRTSLNTSGQMNTLNDLQKYLDFETVVHEVGTTG